MIMLGHKSFFAPRSLNFIFSFHKAIRIYSGASSMAALKRKSLVNIKALQREKATDVKYGVTQPFRKLACD